MKDFFRRNLGLKIISLAMALSLEIWFMSPQNLSVDTISAAVELYGLSPERVIVWPPAAQDGLVAEFKVRGPGPLVQEVKEAPRRFTIQLPSKPPPTYIASLEASDLRLPAGVELLEIKPPRIEFRIEEVVRKELKISVSQLGLPKEGYRIEAVNPEVESVVATGPRGELTQLSAIETEDIDVARYGETVELDVPLRFTSSRISYDRRAIKVRLVIRPIEAEKTFVGLRVGIHAPEGYAASISPSKVNAIFTGRDDALEKLQPESVQLIADLNQFKADSKEKLFQSVGVAALELPEGVRLLETVPPRVEVNLFKKNEP